MDNQGVQEVPGLENIKSKLEEVEHHLQKSKGRQRSLRWWSHGVTLVIIIVFAIYIVGFYKMFGRNLSAENFNKSIQTHMTNFAPVLINASWEVMTQVAPAYVEAAGNKAKALEPEFNKTLGKNKEIFISNMAKFGQNELKTRLEKIVNQQAEEFRKAYPDLTDKQIEQFINETEGISIIFLSNCRNISSTNPTRKSPS